METEPADSSATAVLIIHSSTDQRTYWAEELRRCSPDYQIFDAADSPSGLALFRSCRIDCVVLELSLPDQSGFKTLIELIPIASRPRIAVIVLTRLTHRSVWELARQNGAYACLTEEFTSGENLDRAIQRAIAFVGQMPKDDPHRAI